MSKLRLARPLWLDQLERSDIPRYPVCRGRVEVDVAIVGGGVTGAAVAWKFASAGVKVALLEAHHVAMGSTIASTALLMQEPDKDLCELTERYGSAVANRVWRLSSLATSDFIGTLRRLRIPCSLRRRDSLYFTLDHAARSGLRREQRRRRAAGFAARWLDDAALRAVSGIEGEGAILTTHNAQAQPFAVCAGLLRRAESHGAAIFERSAVKRIERSRGGVLLRLPHATVQARQIVVATGYATSDFKPLIGRFHMMHTYVLATRPLSQRARRRLRLRRLMLWDTARPYHYARWTEDDRLLLGGEDRPRLPGRQRRLRAFNERTEAVRGYFVSIYPSLANVPIDYAWEGLFATTADGLPYIGAHRRYPGHRFALGYGGNGMTFGFMAARLLLAEWLGQGTDDLSLFAFDRHRRHSTDR